MRKSERLRLVEMQVVRLEVLVDMLQAIISAPADNSGFNANELESGKWYNAKPDRDKPEQTS